MRSSSFLCVEAKPRSKAASSNPEIASPGQPTVRPLVLTGGCFGRTLRKRRTSKRVLKTFCRHTESSRIHEPWLLKTLLRAHEEVCSAAAVVPQSVTWWRAWLAGHSVCSGHIGWSRGDLKGFMPKKEFRGSSLLKFLIVQPGQA